MTTDTEFGISLNEGIDVSALLKDGCSFSINFNDVVENRETSYASTLLSDRYLEFCDDESYVAQSFDSLKNLVDITPDGKVKKRTLRKGFGEVPKEKSLVVVNYNAFFEYADEPFDSTYVRNDPLRVHMDDGMLIPGLEIAIKTMCINEKAQVLVHYDYAYGELGVLKRIPPKSTILFEVELKDITDIGQTLTYNTLEKEEKQKFENAYEYALQTCTKGNELIKKNLHKNALYEYNQGIAALQFCKLRDMADQEKQQRLLLRLFSNKIIAHNARNEPKLACTACNEIFNMTKGTCLEVSTKVLYNNAKSLIMLNDLKLAERRLKQAKARNPKDEDIAKLFIQLDKLKAEERERLAKMAGGIIGSGSENGASEGNSTDETFEKYIEEEFQQLSIDNSLDKLTFSSKFTNSEKTCMKSLVEKFNLLYTEDDKNHDVIIKKMPKK